MCLNTDHQRHVAHLQQVIARMRHRSEMLEKSSFWRLRSLFRFFSNREELPPVTTRDFSEAMHTDDPYAVWLLLNEPRPIDLRRYQLLSGILRERPTIGIVIDDVAPYAGEILGSARRQVYANTRILFTSKFSRSSSPAERFNAVVLSSDVDFIAFVQRNEELAPDALFNVALAINSSPGVNVVYGDRDKIDATGRRFNPTFVPDWSPEAFLSDMYTGTFIFYRRSALLKACGFSDNAGSSLHYDMALRVTEHTDRIVHCPAILYHERGCYEPRAHDDRVISAALARRGQHGFVRQIGGASGATAVCFPITDDDHVDVILPTRDRAAELWRCLSSVFGRSSHRSFTVTLLDNGSREESTNQVIESFSEREASRFRVIRVDEPFNFSRLINIGARASRAPFLLLLNNDTEVITADWIECMVGYAKQQGVGAVGARLLYDDGAIQHAGVVVGMGKTAGHPYRRVRPETIDARHPANTVRNYSAVTAACMAVSRRVFDEAGGFDERLAIEFNDVDFCLRLLKKGFRNVYLPQVTLRHSESISRVGMDPLQSRKQSLRDTTLFKRRWQTSRYADPYYSDLNLVLDARSFPNM